MSELGMEVDEPLKPPEGMSDGGIHINPVGLPMVNSLEREANNVISMEGHHGRNKNSSILATLLLAYQTIGVVYGDLGTSPLYVYSAAFTDRQPSENEVLGCLSIIIYTITLICLIKYVFIVLRANDNGNGGEYALYSLICRHAKISVAHNHISEDHEVSSYNIQTPSRNLLRSTRIKEALQRSNFLKNLLLVVTILGTCLVIGDGVLTPCISVLSAIQGIQIAAPSISQDVVVAVTCVILVGLFSLQRFGTDKVGYLFSPVVIIWFASIAILGVYNIAHHGPEVLKAFNPYYIYLFFKMKKVAWTSLGGILLCITGTEAMFADLGHFSVRAIQTAFSTIVYPCLLCAYIGQAAYLMKHPENVSIAFYKSIPDALYWPVFIVATCAAIIASQAMISATFSLVYQAMNLGCFPRVKIVHTSAKYAGQVYIPEMNWIIMILCVIIVVSFRDTSKIGNAYGVAVNADMVINTHLLTLVMVMIWETPLWLALIFYCCISSVELLYFSSVIFKVPQGGYIPIVFMVVFFSIMYSWHYGRAQKYQQEIQNRVPIDRVLALGSDLGKLPRVPGIGLVYTELGQGVPAIFHHLISNVQAMHSVLVFVCVKHLPVSHVPDHERFLFRREGPRQFRMYRCTVRFGYRELKKGDEEDKTFESLLVQCLVNFIMEDYSQAPVLQDASQCQDVNSIGIQIEDPEPSTFETTESSAELVEELTVLNSAVESGIVYLLGHAEIRARKDSSWLKKLVINYGYHILQNNCRSSLVSLHIPRSKLLQGTPWIFSRTCTITQCGEDCQLQGKGCSALLGTRSTSKVNNIRRTVYVGQIGQQVTEEQLVALFVTVGQVVDCRIWGDPKSRLRFGFVEFTEEDGARSALRLSGIMLDCYNSIHVWPSKTGIVPVNPTFLPHSDDERRRCARTIYCKNIDKVLTQTQVKLLFEGLCGKVAQLRLLGNSYHSTQMAFVEFAMPESATAALNWNGAIFGSLPIRVSPSKTPVRFA